MPPKEPQLPDFIEIARPSGTRNRRRNLAVLVTSLVLVIAVTAGSIVTVVLIRRQSDEGDAGTGELDLVSEVDEQAAITDDAGPEVAENVRETPARDIGRLFGSIPP